MIFLYNILQLLLITFFGPILFFICLIIPKYRIKIVRQLGMGSFFPPSPAKNTKRIWIHALSVGEVTSALPLIRGLKENNPAIEICFSANTTTGNKTAVDLLSDYVDFFIPSPLDLYPVVKRFCRKVDPDLYIHVETDFWPNQLSLLKQENIPAILVNGRISKNSFNRYQKFRFFFKPLFCSFHTLSMQTEEDRRNMITLGVEPNKVKTLGNLKYDVQSNQKNSPLQTIIQPFLKKDALLIVAGSTHEGEEEILLSSFAALKKQQLKCQLIIAPRNINRASDITGLAEDSKLTYCKRTSRIEQTDLLILDTLGELYDAYLESDIGFVGGSLTNFGGHNPIEPASCGIPVLFGQYMDDFTEVSSDLLKAGGASMVKNEVELTSTLNKLLTSPETRHQQGKKAEQFIDSQRGVVANHLVLIRKLL